MANETKKVPSRPKLEGAYPKSEPLPGWLREEMERINRESGFGSITRNAPPNVVTKGEAVVSSKTTGLSGALKRSANPPTIMPQGIKTGHSAVNTVNSVVGPRVSTQVVKAGLQGAIITAGFNEWSKLLSNPETTIDMINEAKDFYASIKDLPDDQKRAAITNLSVDVAKEVGKNIKEASQDVIDKGVRIAKDLYDMPAEQRNQFLSDVCKGTVDNLADMGKSTLEILSLPMEDKLALAKNLGRGVINKSKSMALGAKKIFDTLTSR